MPEAVTVRGLAVILAVVEAVVGGAAGVIEAAVASGVGKVVTVLSAPDLYGEVDTGDLPVKEAQTWAPRTARGVAEVAVAGLLANARADHQVEFTALALAEVYGPRARRGLVAGLRQADARAVVAAEGEGATAVVVGDPRRTVDLTWVDDVVDALVRAADRGSGLVINIGTGVQTPVRVLHERLTGRPPARTAGSGGEHLPNRFALSVVRARIHLGWAPWTTLDEGLAQLGPR